MARAVLKGLPVSPGIAIGSLLHMPDSRFLEKRHIPTNEIDKEISSLEKASLKVCEKLQRTIDTIPDSLKEYRDILLTQMEMARDSKILEGTKARIKKRQISASWALRETIEELCSIFMDMADPYLADRAQDIRLAGRSLIEYLDNAFTPFSSSTPGILAARDIAPGDLAARKPDELLGILTTEGGATSHTAILARGLKVPAIVGIPDLLKVSRPGESVIMDGLSGLVLLSPDKADAIYYASQKENYEAFEKEAKESASLRARTRDGKVLSIYANLDNPIELASLDHSGAEGIGLYRTEFAWLSGTIPTEEKLVREYENVINQVSPKPVTFRTLDLGANKLLSGRESLHEPNPALGLRGIRFCLHRKDLFRTQLRAILRAVKGKNAAIMLPMVSNLQEIEETRILLREISHELKKEKKPHADNLPLGVMVETPSAVMIADALAEKCDFLSLGTNDLLHYLMAIDRNNLHVAYLHEPLHPAFIRSIKRVIDVGHALGQSVSVCGELAADPFGISLLLGLGIDQLSASPRFIPAMKHMIRRLNSEQCSKISQKALNELDIHKTRADLHKILKDALGAELGFHNTFIRDNNW